MMLLFPLPVRPINATDSPGFIRKETLFIARLAFESGLYEAETFLNSISPRLGYV